MAERIKDRLVVLDSADREVLAFDARFAVLDLGARGAEGDLRIRGDDGEFKFVFDSGQQVFILRDDVGRDVLHFQAKNSQLRVGRQDNEGDIYVLDAAGEASIHLDGGAGDIILRNADCAEEFDCAEEQAPDPGTVVVLDDDGSVRVGTHPYDRRVAGIVSGAGEHRPGIVLDRRHGPRPRVPVAVMGKVSCRVDATHGPVGVGDLLTTSPTVGHAMKASDSVRAIGTVVGKAMQPLAHGLGLVPVLVTLQ